MIVISSKVIGTDIILNNDYCDYRKYTNEVIIDLERLKEVLEDIYSYGKLGCVSLDPFEYGGKNNEV